MLNQPAVADADVHLLAIRKALANRSAAVMVGAGFSKNAEGGENLATWRQLTSALYAELEPGRKVSDFSPGAAAQLAEQYAKVFSPAHLEMLIKRCVPDDQVSPGKLHTRLLELPWSEIFTTNYDTLLERTAERMFEVGYFTVCAREDIPQSKVLGRRRIVKLHGSFPSHRPFILTEEEYRTYPERFAPFVNMVRQSLLENVFCLIGFSGDDPNFLHWLGWVRDMLDKHALPVYLFLAQEPTLGERKLYEARGVVPVVLPTSIDSPPEDFKARYEALFRKLAEPLENSPLDWELSDKIPYIQAEGEIQAQFLSFMQGVAKIAESRADYPGWIVAPKKVRSRLRQAAERLEQALTHGPLLKHLSACPPDLVLLVIDCYCWTQEVVLGPIVDDIAELGRAALLGFESTEVAELGGEATTLMEAIQASEANSPKRVRVRVAMALLTWARQSHHTSQYNELRTSLEEMQKDDARVPDHLAYEQILNSLQHADLPTALANTLRWRPTTANAYAHVLRGALLAELGDIKGARVTLGSAIQIIRRQQRSRPNDPELISQEAWACLVANQLHLADDFLSRAGKGAAGDDASLGEDSVGEGNSISKEDLSERLSVLATRGYSAEEELSHFLSGLNAEATPPAPSQRTFVGFDIGTSSSQQSFGTPLDLTRKISAGFAWLELVERVGIPHRTNGVLFNSDEMLQAAWWARFRDTAERSMGLFLRAQRKNAMKPRDRHRSPHLTGWLDRYEVARLQTSTATELAQAMVDQLKGDLQDGRPDFYPRDRAEFLLEVFVRLAVRVQDTAKVRAWASDLLALHRNAEFQSNSALWGLASKAITRLMESLPEEMHSSLLIDVYRLPLEPASADFRHRDLREMENWVDVRMISRVCKIGLSGRHEIQNEGIIDQLIDQLRSKVASKNVAQLWVRLYVLDHMKILTREQRQAAGDMLWTGVETGSWPTLPGLYPGATLHWPSPHAKPASAFLDWLLAHPLAFFRSGNARKGRAGSDRSYCTDAQDTVRQIHAAISFAPPSLPHISKTFWRIEEWLDAQQINLLDDIKDDDIHDAVANVCRIVVEIISGCLETLKARKQTKTTQSLISRAHATLLRLECFPIPHVRIGVRLLSIDATSRVELLENAKALAHKVATGAPERSGGAFRACFDLLSLEDPRIKEAGQLIFDALVASILMQRVVSLHHTLHLLASLPKHSWRRYANRRTLSLIDIALTELLSVQNYKHVRQTDSVPPESIPQVRYFAMRLAHTMVEVNKLDSPGARSWLEEAKSDPLPEIRLERFRTDPN